MPGRRPDDLEATHRPTTPRRHFAAGEYLTRYAESAPYRLRIDTPREKPGWQARRPGDQIHAAHAGTPVLFESTYWEVVLRERAAHGERWVYHLAPWDERYPLRPPREYSKESCEREAAEYRRSVERSAVARTLRVLGPVIALLPAHDQRTLEHELAFPAVHWTLVSSAVLWSASTAIVVAGIAQTFSPGRLSGLAWAVPALPFAAYFAFESFVRFLSAMRFNEPMGSLPVWLPLETVRAVRRALAPESRLERLRQRQERARPQETLEGGRDEVRTRETAEGVSEIEVTSLLPKPHWTINQTAIYVDDICYYLAEREIRDTPDGPRHVFVLRRPEEEMLFRDVAQYVPEEVQALHAERRRQALGTWVETFAPLFGFLDASTQGRLAKRFSYDAGRSTRSSIVIAVVVGLTGAVAALSYLSSFGVGDLLVLSGAVLLLGESIARARRLSAGEIQGSALGRLLRPLAERLLR